MPKKAVNKKKPTKKAESGKKETVDKKVNKSKSKRPAGRSTGPKGINWSVWREKYVTTVDKITYAEISKHVGVNPATVEKRAAKENWRAQRIDYFTEVAREWREMCKNETNAVKMENLKAIRAVKTILKRQLAGDEDNTVTEIKGATVGDLLALVKQEIALLDPGSDADLTVKHSMDENQLKEVLKTALKTGQVDRTALRKAARNS